MTAVSIIVIPLALFQVKNQRLLLVLYPWIGFFTQTLSTNIDIWLLRSCKGEAGTYGKIRSVGSISYALVSLMGGFILKRYGYNYMIYGGVAILVIILLLEMSLPDCETKEEVKSRSVSLSSIKEIFSSNEYVIMLLILLFIGLSSTTVHSLKIVLMKNVGGDVADMGVDSFAGTIIQAPLLLFSARIQSIPIKRRFMLMSSLPMLMLLITYLADRPWMIMIGTLFFNMNYAIMLPSMREVTERNVINAHLNLGHQIADAVYGSLSNMIGMLYAGSVIEKHGVNIMLIFCMILDLVAIIISVYYSVSQRQERLKKGIEVTC